MTESEKAHRFSASSIDELNRHRKTRYGSTEADGVVTEITRGGLYRIALDGSRSEISRRPPAGTISNNKTQPLPGSCPQWSSDHRELTRIGVIKKCTLTEITTALLVTAERSLDKSDAGCWIRYLFISGHTSKGRFYENIFVCLHF